MAADTGTRDALSHALLKLAEEPVEALRREAPIRSPFLNALLHPDDVKQVLRWLNDQKGFRDGATPEQWAAFVALCRSRYGFHPETDGPISAARLLGQRNAAWDRVWKRFAEAPESYRAVPDVLRQTRPTQTLSMLDPVEPWPQENEAAESTLRQAPPDMPAGTCLLFTDGLRYDVGQPLRALLEDSGAEARIAARLGASILLIPISARKQLNELSDEMAMRLSILYYADAREALLKAFGD